MDRTLVYETRNSSSSLDRDTNFLNMKRFKDYQVKYMESMHERQARFRKQTSHYGRRFWYIDVTEYNIWNYTNSLLKKSIGQDVDKVFSKLVDRAKTFHKRYYSRHSGELIDDFAEKFNNHPNKPHCSFDYYFNHYNSFNRNHIYKYTIDSQNRIQYTKEYLDFKKEKQHVQYRIKKYNRNVTFIGKSIFSEKSRIITNRTHPRLYKLLFEKHSERPYDKIIFLKKNDCSIYDSFWNLYTTFEVSIKQEIQTVSRRKFIQISYENRQRIKLQNIDRKKALRLKEYSFLSKEEVLLQKEKELDKIKLLKHGFDEESFKGEHYHGQKRKKNV